MSRLSGGTGRGSRAGGGIGLFPLGVWTVGSRGTRGHRGERAQKGYNEHGGAHRAMIICPALPRNAEKPRTPAGHEAGCGGSVEEG
jgi:hypothetical protein